MGTKMKKLLVFLLAIGACNSMDASIKWDEVGQDTTAEETYDFEAGGFYYGIISEMRGEVHVMSPNLQSFDPYPRYHSPTFWPGYRVKFELEEEDYYYWPGGEYEGDIEIPAEVEHNGKLYKVVRIAFGAFAWCDKLTSVKLPPTIREIRYGAFSMCTSLKDVNLPAGTRVCGGAFYGCTSLEFLDFSRCTFQYNKEWDHVVCQCAALRELYFPESYNGEHYSCYSQWYDEPGMSDYQWLSDYYRDYDDFPYADNMCDNSEEGMLSIKLPNIKRTSVAEDEPIWKYPTQTAEFLGCYNLKEIHCGTMIPVQFLSKQNENSWAHLYEDCVLYVPKGSLDDYRNAEPWKYFKNIVEEEGTSGIEEAVPDVDAPADGERRIYDLSGRQRATVPAGKTPALAPGLYIERTPTSSRKLRIP